MTRWSVNRKILAAFGTGLLALVLTGVISYRNALQFLETSRWVEHTHTVLRELDQVNLSIATVESAVRGYVLTGDTSFLGSYESETGAVNDHIERLNELTADNPGQQRRLPRLIDHVASKLAIQQLFIDELRNKGFETARALVATGEGKAQMDSIESVLDEMRAEEERLLQLRAAQSQQSADNAFITFSVLTTLDFVFFAFIYYLTRRDLTQRKRAEEALEREQHLLTTLMDYLPDSIFFKDRAGRFTRINRAMAERFGLSSTAQAVGMSDFDFFSIEYAQPAHDVEQKIISSGKPLVDVDEKEVRLDASLRWVRTTRMPLRDVSGEIAGTFGITSDISRSKQVEHLLQEMAVRDQLTGLYNRREMDRMLKEEILRYKRYGHPVTLAMIDVDHFKQVNDTYGHQIGDEVLKWLAGLLRANVRQLDCAARYGGEEFAVILPETWENGGYELVERFRELVAAQPFRSERGGWAAVEIPITISVGVACISQDMSKDPSEETLVAATDKALYEAKHSGRNRTIAVSALATHQLALL